MNPLLNTLQPYPFAKLRKLLEGAKLPEDLKPISLSIGEPTWSLQLTAQDW